MPSTTRLTPEQWQDLIQQQHVSGLSATDFCKVNDIGYASFCNWRTRLSQQDASGRPCYAGVLKKYFCSRDFFRADYLGKLSHLGYEFDLSKKVFILTRI